MWDLEMFFYELRLSFSICLLCVLWYRMGLLDWYLCSMLERVGSRILKVPVTGSVTFYFPNAVMITNIRVKPPPPEVDSRWEWEDIVTVDLVNVKFNCFLSAAVYLFSYGELAVAESICVHGLRFFVEGHRPAPSEDMTFNVTLLGGAKRNKQEPAAAEGAATVFTKMECVEEEYFAEPAAPAPALTPSTGSSLLSNGKASIASYVKSSAKALRQFNDSVSEAGLVGATRRKLTHLYHHTKASIELSLRERIKALHIKLSGAEPAHAEGEQRFICDLLVFDDIEVHMLRALPIHIRHLEQQPLTVRRLQFDHLGYEGLTVAHRSSTPFPCPEHAQEEVSYSDITDGLIVAKDKSSKSSKEPVPSAEACSLPIAEQQLQQLDAWSIDLYASGLDVMIFKHRFEQQMMLALCQGNAGRLVMDMFNVSHWGKGSHPAEHAHEAAAAVHGHGHFHSKSLPSPSTSTSSSSAQQRQQQQQQDLFIYSNPLFFDD